MPHAWRHPDTREQRKRVAKVTKVQTYKNSRYWHDFEQRLDPKRVDTYSATDTGLCGVQIAYTNGSIIDAIVDIIGKTKQTGCWKNYCCISTLSTR